MTSPIDAKLAELGITLPTPTPPLANYVPVVRTGNLIPLDGKVVSGVAARCRRAGVPCVAIVGGMNADACELLDCGVDALVPTVIDAASIEEVLANAERNFRLAAQRVFSLVSLGRKMGENQ